MQADDLYARMTRILDKLSDTALLDAIEAIARNKEINPYIRAGLVAEATVRNLDLSFLD